MDNAEKRRLASDNPDSYNNTPWLTARGRERMGYSNAVPASDPAIQQAAQRTQAALVAQRAEAALAAQQASAAESRRQAEIKAQMQAQTEAGRQAQLQGESAARQSLSGMNAAQQAQNKTTASSQSSVTGGGGGFDMNQNRQASLQQFSGGTPQINQGSGGTQRPSNLYNLPAISGLTFGGA